MPQQSISYFLGNIIAGAYCKDIDSESIVNAQLACEILLDRMTENQTLFKPLIINLLNKKLRFVDGEEYWQSILQSLSYLQLKFSQKHVLDKNGQTLALFIELCLIDTDDSKPIVTIAKNTH